MDQNKKAEPFENLSDDLDPLEYQKQMRQKHLEIKKRNALLRAKRQLQPIAPSIQPLKIQNEAKQQAKKKIISREDLSDTMSLVGQNVSTSKDESTIYRPIKEVNKNEGQCLLEQQDEDLKIEFKDENYEFSDSSCDDHVYKSHSHHDESPNYRRGNRNITEGEQSHGGMFRNMSKTFKNMSVSIGAEAQGAKENMLEGLDKINQTFQDMFDEKIDEGMVDNFDSAQNYKQQYINQYGVTSTIPSLYVQQAVWYPIDPSYFVQIVNYVVPKSQDYDVNTYYTFEKEGGKDARKFEDIFKDKITGCAIRLIKTNDDLSQIEVINEFVYSEDKRAILRKQNPRVDKLSISFSYDGKVFVLFSKENNFIKVYELTAIEDILSIVERDQPVIDETYIDDASNQEVENVSFGTKSKYMLVQYTKKLVIYDINKMIKEKKSYIPKEYVIPHIKFERICDFYFQSDSQSDRYICYIACKVQGAKKIKIFDVKKMDEDEVWEDESHCINFFQDVSKNMTVKFQVYIEEKITKITTVFVNGDEQFVINMNSNEEGSQKKLSQIGEKKIQYIMQDRNKDEKNYCYFIIACSEYDQSLHLFKSDDLDYHVQIKRNIQPNIIRIFNAVKDSSGTIKVLSLKDDEFIIDQIKDLGKSNDDSHMRGVLSPQTKCMDLKLNRWDISTYLFSSVRAFSFNWPYITFSGLQNFLLIINLFDRKQIYRVQMAPIKQSIQVCQTFITNTKDLFLVVKAEDKFRVLSLDLDSINRLEREVDDNCFKFKLEVEYTAQEVKNAHLTSMFARGSSRKERIQTNHKLMLFFQHDTNLYAWAQGYTGENGKKLIHMQISPSLTINSDTLDVMDENSFCYCQKSRSHDNYLSQVIHVKIGFSDYTQEIMAQENEQQYDYLNFRVDRAQNKLLIVSKEVGKVNYDTDPIYITIKDLNFQDKIVIDCQVFDPNLKGIFVSGQYILIDGHIYFKNNVIKLRYDLMSYYGPGQEFHQIYFNQYENIIKLNEGETIKTLSPLDSIQTHRFAYIILNENLEPKRLMMLPYLHERKIFLNRIKQNTKYFYTSKQTIIHDCTGYDNNDNVKKAISYIFAVNLTESKYYVYSEKGMLLNRFDFSQFTKKWGQVVSVSQNGLIYALHNKVNDIVTLLQFTEKKAVYLKTIRIIDQIREFSKRQVNKAYDDIKHQTHWIYENSITELNYKIKINNKADVMIKITSLKEDQLQSLFYFHANFKINKIFLEGQKLSSEFQRLCKQDRKHYYQAVGRDLENDQDVLQGQNILLSYNKDLDFNIDNRRAYFWDKNKIFYYLFSKMFKPENRKDLKFQISGREQSSYIKAVYPTDKSDTIAIVIEQIQGSLVLSWDFNVDAENNAYEVKKKHEIIWGQQGEFLIVSDVYTTIPTQNCNLKCFHIENFHELTELVSCPEMGYHNGYRFDSAQHNWVLMNQYICLSFSYMTFVIQCELEDINLKNNQDTQMVPLLDQAFDIEAFTYMLNKNSCFTSGNMMKDNFLKLQSILSNLMKSDPIYLEVLHYFIDNSGHSPEQSAHDKMQKNFVYLKHKISSMRELKEKIRSVFLKQEKEYTTKSALHQAFLSGNNRFVDIILSHMAMIKINNSIVFKDIIYYMTDIQSFGHYLGSLVTQTNQMKDKRVLRVKQPLNDSIIAMASSHTAFIDDKFYQDHFYENVQDASMKAFPVEVVCLRIDWIITTKQGRKFLQAINQSERLDFYEIKTLQVIIEFLYQKTKNVMLAVLLPMYLIQLSFFVLAIIYTELKENVHGDKDHHDTIVQYHYTAKIFVILNQIQTFILMLIMIRVFMLTGKKYLYRVYTWFDLTFYIFNTIANFHLLTKENEDSIKDMRVLYAFAILFFLASTMYFMKLIDNIAPIIDIIIRIFFDIKWFVFVFLCVISAFGFSFYLLGSNQMQFDEIPADQIYKIKYTTLLNSFYFMWDVCIGGGDTAGFALGKASQKAYLDTLSITAQFILLIHLLNMLIAIMGDTFSRRNEVAEQIKIKDHLSFVIDNWYLKDFSLGNSKQIKYIITAFHVPHDDENENEQRLRNLEESLQSLKEQVSYDHQEVIKKQRKQEVMLAEVLRGIERIKHYQEHHH